MSKYYVIVNKNTGELFSPLVQDNDDKHIPEYCVYKTFSETDPDYELLYALFVEDPNRITTTIPNTYIHPEMGGVTFDFIKNSWQFQKEDISIDLDLLRKQRNELLNFTDAFMVVPDLEQSIKTKMLTYRENLRDMTTKATNGTWLTKYDVVWPEFPEELKA